MREKEEMIEWEILNPILIKLNNALINGEINETKELLKQHSLLPGMEMSKESGELLV